MKLSTLLASIYPLDQSLDRDILGLAQDSRRVQPGYLFLARAGRNFDGRLYITEALRQGASFVLAETEQENPSLEWQAGIPILHLPKFSAHLFELAAHFYSYPAGKLKLLGTTGTNGKTSCSHYLAQALQKLHYSCGVIGTLGSGMLGSLKETLMTTPDIIELQKILAELRALRAQYVAMEVSSHSLDQKRIEGLSFELGIFTNLTQDHLDYHETMADYAAAKKRFFTDYTLGRVVLNADDAFGRSLMDCVAPEQLLVYSTEGRVEGYPSIFVEKAIFNHSGIQAEVQSPWGKGELRAPLLGTFNLSNMLAVLAALCSLEFPFEEVLSCFPHLTPVAGRMQLFGGGEKPTLVVDYAHTPDALEKVLKTLRRQCQGKLYCLFGCGGDRDQKKRPLMGAIAEHNADFVMLTNDNPRHEDPDSIINDIIKGFQRPQKLVIQKDRFKAIQDIIQCAAAGDYVLIAGKGAEPYQQFGDERIAFSDANCIETILRMN